MLNLRISGYLASAFFVLGCGSDNVTNITIIEAPKSPQAPLVFSLDAQNYFIDETPEANRLSGGSGAGNIVYTSSNSAIAMVNADTGELDLIDDGTAVITATKAGDDIYGAASASYEVTINKYDRWYTTTGLFVQPEYIVALSETEAEGNPFKPTNLVPIATTALTIEANLPASNSYLDPNDFDPDNSATFNASTSLTIYDSLGEDHVLTIYFLKDGNTYNNSWLMVTAVDGEFYDFANIDGTDPSSPIVSAGFYDNYMGFNSTLPIANAAVAESGIWATRLNFSTDGDLVSIETPDGWSLPGGGTNLTFSTTTPLYGLTTGADRSQTIAFHISLDTTGLTNDGITQFAAPFSIAKLDQDGVGIGDLNPALVSYFSEAPGIAMVDENTGWLTLVSRGETNITARVAEDDYYAETAISYRLIVE